MTRMRLASQRKGVNNKSKSTVSGVLALSVAMIILNGLFAHIILRRLSLLLVIVCAIPTVILDLGALLFFYSLTIKTRAAVRNMYNIPESRCAGCEDVAVSLCCTSCAISQMGRHTADYDTFRGSCCTDTGLPGHIEAVVNITSDAGTTHDTINRPEEFAYHKM